MSPFRETRVYRPKVRIANIRRYRAEAALNGPVTDRLQTNARPSRDGFERFGSGTQANGQITAKFEPAAWGWDQMTSGSGAPNENAFCLLSEEAITFKLHYSRIEYLDRRARL